MKIEFLLSFIHVQDSYTAIVELTFLDQPGIDSDVKGAFDAVDINGSGLVEIDEFMFSIMGESANKYGGLADLERVTTLLGDLTGKYSLMMGSVDGMKEDADERARKNRLLRDR